MSSDKSLPELSEIEIRVLGALMEKSKTTPDYYPMTLNAITAACNQKTSRNPVTDYSEEQVMSAIRSLKGYGYVSISVGGTNRSEKFKHNFSIHFPVNDAQESILCLLFLRGPQTAGELNTNSGRLYEFSSLGSVQETLHALAEAQPPMVAELPRKPGQKETRYRHLFGTAFTEEHFSSAAEITQHSPTRSELENRVQMLEEEVSVLKTKLSKICAELGISEN